MPMETIENMPYNDVVPMMQELTDYMEGKEPASTVDDVDDSEPVDNRFDILDLGGKDG